MPVPFLLLRVPLTVPRPLLLVPLLLLFLLDEKRSLRGLLDGVGGVLVDVEDFLLVLDVDLLSEPRFAKVI